MNSLVFLLIGVGAIGAAPLIAGIGLVGKDRERASVNRTLAMIERGYAVSHPDAGGRSLGRRMGLPLARKLGGMGKALTPAGTVVRLQRQLDYAGNPADWPVQRVVAAKGVGLVVGAIVISVFGLLLGAGPTGLLGSALIGAVLGFVGPDLLIYNHGAKRQEELRKTLPDVLDTLTVCVEAGQGFDAAMAQVSRNGKGPMVGEAARVLQEMRIGKSRSDALRAMSARTKVSELKGFSSAVVQASDLGVPMANVLREQSKEMRIRRRQRAEEQAQKVPIKVLFPTLFCLFPSLFVIVIGPAVINVLNTFGKH